MLKRSPGVKWHPHGTLRCPHDILRCPHDTLKCPHSTLRCPHSALRCPHGSLLCPHSALRCPHGTLKCPHDTLRCPGDGGTHWRTSWSSGLMDQNLVGLRRPSGRRASTSHTTEPSCRQLPSPPPGWAQRPPGAGASSLGHFPPIFTHPLHAWPGCGLARGGEPGAIGARPPPGSQERVGKAPRARRCGRKGTKPTLLATRTASAGRCEEREGFSPRFGAISRRKGVGDVPPRTGGSVSSSSPPSQRPCEEPPARRDASSAAFEARLGSAGG